MSIPTGVLRHKRFAFFSSPCTFLLGVTEGFLNIFLAFSNDNFDDFIKLIYYTDLDVLFILVSLLAGEEK